MSLTTSEPSDGSVEFRSGERIQLRLNWMVWRTPGDPLSRTILGATNWARGGAGSADAHARVTALLDSTRVLVGVVADDRVVSDDDARFQALVALTALLDGLLFNGHAFADASGAVLIHA